MSKYFPSYLSELSGIKHVTVNVDLEGLATKDDLKYITHVDTASLALKTNLSSLKTEVDKLDIPKLITLPTDLSKLTNKVANDLVEETDFNATEKKVTANKIDQDDLEIEVQNKHLTTESSINNLKTKVNGIAGNLELKIPDISGLLQTSVFNSKVSELENKIRTAETKPDIRNLATKSGLKNVEDKIPSTDAFV